MRIVATMRLEELLDALEFTEAVLSGKTGDTDKKYLQRCESMRQSYVN
ncbi:hypothetical protein [uncultured Clostridium sp.]|nr:hypothetical protein [uncultured Clostridium sp.]